MLEKFKTENDLCLNCSKLKEVEDLRSGRDQKTSLDLKSFLDPTRLIAKEVKKSKLQN